MIEIAGLPNSLVRSDLKSLPLEGISARDERILDEDILNVLNSVRDLMKKYRMYSKASESRVVSGGLQQYLIRKLKQRTNSPDQSTLQRLQALYLKDSSTVHVNISDCDEDKTDPQASFFSNMPVNVKLQIFSYLDARELCHACSVCQEWNRLACDNLLWQQRLQYDLPGWDTISHIANPQLYKDAKSDWSDKKIYMKCSPEVHKCYKQQNSTFHQVSHMLRYFLPRKAPKVAMFGPGLESDTSGIVRKMLYEDNEKFTRVAMFPGQFEGVGAGMTLKLQTGQNFHLTVLYSATKRERKNSSHRQSLGGNRLMIRQNHGAENGGNSTYELQHSVRDLCHTLDAFFFVVDASQTKENIAIGKEELFAMVSERWSAPHIPVLVLSCVRDMAAKRTPAIDVVEALELSELNRPWLVHNAVVDSLEGVSKGIEWIVEQSQHH